MRRWTLCWLILFFTFHHNVETNGSAEQKNSGSPGCCKVLDRLNCKTPSEPEQKDADYASCCMKTLPLLLNNVHLDDTIKALGVLQKVLEETETTNSTALYQDNMVALLYKPTDDFKGLQIAASDNQVMADSDVPNSKVKVHLPSELNVGQNDTIVFCTIQLPNEMALERIDELYGRRLVGLSVRGRNVSGLQDRVNITINIETSKTMMPKCVFLNTTEKNFSTSGCETKREQNQIICSCDHLTYFGLLMVSAELSPEDEAILSYISYIGCGISLTALVIAVLLFITNRKLRADDSKKIHISLAVALILLNVHFLSCQAAAASSSTELCFYVALLLHYSLLASFTWMALEGFHLYLVLVKVFNIYVRRYLLKLSVVGWGLPAVIVSVVVIIDHNMYGRASLDKSRPNETTVCYVTDDNVKMGTTLGLFGMVFVINGFVFGGIMKWLMCGKLNKPQTEPSKKSKTKQELFTLLVLMILLGLTWGLIFFSFGHLTTAGLYIFCIINSLQGFFILIYFVLSMKKIKASAEKPSTQTFSTKS
ncbi:adhesion G-protein coupled receptor G2-like isoform X1 [Gambusia affinis]|uniref:adhesion G-protein coupled receptor G2-like isoform X1 n=1 Tax=Gambusia affinis TaxID=33528 RepID=UPI001CDCE595|nr:adhesion G-protein coupled receptor G2-like isoform X1 [Gambusia affinis]XP_043955092.1 adhesion G-protein coupled receptor G2-like isoform X1 [Gambusia affinis]XP_043955101.1 adhesion G-protein coupled receptor G2-like isoform X1 [Gambusia affinis]